VSSAGTARSGSYPGDLAAIIGLLQLGPFMACTDRSLLNATDHRVGNRREENLHAQLLRTTGRSLRFAAPGAVQPHRVRAVVGFQLHELAGAPCRVVRRLDECGVDRLGSATQC